jgi:hypothetical protein
MNLRTPFARKITYLVAIVALLPLLSWLSQPASLDQSGRGRQPGGKLAQLRDTHGLSQANLGEIDPASETMKLATLGMRGVAVNLLWTKVLEYQKVKDFTSLSATLEQITKLQPNFVRVWVFQGWNLSYNISVEFDDYHDRYHWVIKGINFIKEGTQYNRDEPTLLREIGRTVSQKMGRSDERVQFRRLFREDDDFHGNRPVGERDSWLVGKEWFLKAVDAVELGGRRMKSGITSEGTAEGASPLIYLSEAPLCQIYCAAAMEEEGKFDRESLAAWEEAEQDWLNFGQREILISTGNRIRLTDYDYFSRRIDELSARLDRLAPGVREQIVEERRAALSDEEREALETPAEQRSMQQFLKAEQASYKLVAHPMEIASRSPQAAQIEAVKVAADILRADERRGEIDTSRNIVNYAYWLARCQAEKTPAALEARKLLYQAQRAQLEVELEAARESYEQGFQKWKQVLDENPVLARDGITAEEIIDDINAYRRCLKELDEPFPTDFPLNDLLKEFEHVFSPQSAAQREDQPTASDAK